MPATCYWYTADLMVIEAFVPSGKVKQHLIVSIYRMTNKAISNH